MTAKPVREIRRLTTLTESEATPWGDLCAQAYGLVRDAVGADDIRNIEPDHNTPAGMEWRLWGHNADGTDSVYVAIIQPPPADEPEDEERDYVIDLDEVVRLLQVDHGVHSYVEQTGGGCATIYAGAQRPDLENDPDGTHGDTRWAASAGPGTFGWGKRPSVGSLGELYVGPDDNGVIGAIDSDDVGAINEADVAKLIAAQAMIAGPSRLLTDAEVDALGLDGRRGRETGR